MLYSLSCVLLVRQCFACQPVRGVNTAPVPRLTAEVVCRFVSLDSSSPRATIHTASHLSIMLYELRLLLLPCTSPTGIEAAADIAGADHGQSGGPRWTKEESASSLNSSHINQPQSEDLLKRLSACSLHGPYTAAPSRSYLSILSVTLPQQSNHQWQPVSSADSRRLACCSARFRPLFPAAFEKFENAGRRGVAINLVRDAKVLDQRKRANTESWMHKLPTPPCSTAGTT